MKRSLFERCMAVHIAHVTPEPPPRFDWVWPLIWFAVLLGWGASILL